MAIFGIRNGRLPVFAAVAAERLEIEPARGHVEALLETAGKIRRRTEAAGKGTVGERWLAPGGPVLLRHQVKSALQANAFHEFVERLANQRPEDAMKMERRETGDARDDVEVERLVEIQQDVVDSAVNAIDVIERLGAIGCR